MPIYQVLGNLRHDGEQLDANSDPIELTPKQAKPLLAIKVIAGPVNAEAPKQVEFSLEELKPFGDIERAEDVLAHMQTMQLADPQQTNAVWWTQAKTPDSSVLSERLGFNVSAKARNDLWALLQSKLG